MTRRALLLPLLAALAAPAAADADEGSFAVAAARVLAQADRDLADSVVVVERGRITAIVPRDQHRGPAPLEAPGAWLTAGLVDGHAYASGFRDLEESIEAVTPELTALHAFDPLSGDVARLAALGVTSFHLAPRDGNVIGGRTAVLRSRCRAGQAVVLRPEAGLKLSLGDEALKSTRAPTSRPGAAQMLRSLFGRALGRLARPLAADDPRAVEARMLLEGNREARVHASSEAEVLAALQLTDEFRWKLTLLHAREAGPVAADVARRGGVSAVLGPYRFSDPDRVLSGAAALRRAGVRIAFASDFPRSGTDALRLTAALAVRSGLDRADAFRALTQDAAAILGVGDRGGTIEAGKDADLVLWDGDPLLPASAPLCVWVEGVEVYRRKGALRS
jgi:imidazolonepropionase-like amidohydrolase